MILVPDLCILLGVVTERPPDFPQQIPSWVDPLRVFDSTGLICRESAQEPRQEGTPGPGAYDIMDFHAELARHGALAMNLL